MVKEIAPSAERCIIIETVPWNALSSMRLDTEGFVEIDLVVSGRGTHQIPDQIVPCEERDICVLSSHTLHEYKTENAESGPTIRRILFDPKIFLNEETGDEAHPRFCHGVFSEGTTVSYATLNKKTWNEIEPLFWGIERELQEQRPDWKAAVGSYLSVLLITISRYMSLAIRNVSGISRKDRSLISSALRIVNEEFSSAALTLESISAALFVSPSQLSRSFKLCTERSFSDYLKEVRMAHACRLLEETTLTLEEIIEDCGLRDLQTFYRGFRRYTNLTPSQYRRQYNKIQFNESKGERIMIILSEISEKLQKGKFRDIKEMVQQAIDEGVEPAKILTEGLLDGMGIIGEKFKNNEVYVPEVMIAARAMNTGLSVLKPYLVSSGVEAAGKVCIGTVQGDLHDIGKNIVKMMLEGKGLEVIDLGTDVPAEVFVQTAKEQGCKVICCSALLTTTMDVMGEVVKQAEAAGIRDQVKIMVGGAPVNQEFCDLIGADCYTTDAATAADAALAFCK